ncbi:MAG TPA: isoprenylcysteine carboxylmethyltransferase family protein [Myxococcota bacterium]|nr:isoprenylcysteine carboxylmethyltransferase family protein [Myxococcota bacterium]
MLELLARIALPATAFTMATAAFAWPALRLYRQTGLFVLTAGRNREGVELFVHVLFVVGLAIYMGFAGAYGALGASYLGVEAPGIIPLVAGIGACVCGLVVVVVAQQQMGQSWRVGIDTEETELVTSGLYSVIRAPIYLGILVMLAGVVLLAPLLVLVAGYPLVLGTLMWQARREEQHMRSLHPEAFDAWAAKTGRFLPGIGRL